MYGLCFVNYIKWIKVFHRVWKIKEPECLKKGCLLSLFKYFRYFCLYLCVSFCTQHASGTGCLWQSKSVILGCVSWVAISSIYMSIKNKTKLLLCWIFAFREKTPSEESRRHYFRDALKNSGRSTEQRAKKSKRI